MEETVKEQAPVTSPETVKKQEPVIETVTNQTNFKLRRERSELQNAWFKQLGKTSVMLKEKKKERLLQELQDQQALHNQHDVATIKELIKDEEPVKQVQTAIYIVLGLVAIIGFGAYCRYSRKAQSLTDKTDTIKDDTLKADTPDVQSIKTVKSGIVNME